jgi:hypothetical protein
MSAADHYAQAEHFLTEARGNNNPLMTALVHAVLAVAGFLVQFSVPATTVLSEDAIVAQRVVEE